MLSIRSFNPTILYLFLFSSLNALITYSLTAQQADPKTRVKNINFEIGDKNEKVTIELDRFTVPTIFDLNEKNPRLVIDIMNALPWKGRYKVPVNGKLISQIRTYFHKDSEKIRVVLDLNPSTNYAVRKIFLSEKVLIVFKLEE